MPKPRTSPIWSISDEDFAKLVACSRNKTEILNFFGFQNKGQNAHTLNRRILEQGLEVSHLIHSSIGHKKSRRYTNEEIFVESSLCSTRVARDRIIKDGLIPYSCSCGITNKWQGKPIVLQLDHINGKNRDHRISNLRWICPNCHSQTENFAGRAMRGAPKPHREKIVYRGQQHRGSKLTDDIVLKIRASTDTHLKIAAKYNVSDVLVGKIRRRLLWTHI